MYIHPKLSTEGFSLPTLINFPHFILFLLPSPLSQFSFLPFFYPNSHQLPLINWEGFIHDLCHPKWGALGTELFPHACSVMLDSSEFSVFILFPSFMQCLVHVYIAHITKCTQQQDQWDHLCIECSSMKQNISQQLNSFTTLCSVFIFVAWLFTSPLSSQSAAQCHLVAMNFWSQYCHHAVKS